MSKPIARLGDSCSGTCFAHESPVSVTGTIESGSPTSSTDGKPTARLGDSVSFSCGHKGTINSGSAVSNTDGKPTARLGDSVVGPMVANISSGSPSSTSL